MKPEDPNGETIPTVSAEEIASERTPIYDKVWMRTTLDNMLEGLRDLVKPPLFVPTGGHSGKVRCTVCGREGYPTGDYRRGWQFKCRQGHPHVCSCGRLFPTRQGIAAHMRMTGHKEKA